MATATRTDAPAVKPRRKLATPQQDDAPRQKWEKRSTESAPAFAAFVLYRDLGPDRSIDAAWQRAKNAPDPHQRRDGQWALWSSEHNWAERADAWDMECDRVRREAILKQHKTLGSEYLTRCRTNAEKLVTTGQDALTLAQRAIKSFESRDIETVSPAHISSLISSGTKAIQTGLDAEAMAIALDSLLKQEADRLAGDDLDTLNAEYAKPARRSETDSPVPVS